MSDDRSATEVWLDWFAERNVWFGLGDAGAGPYVQCEAAISADSSDGERQAFLFHTFDPEGWFMVLDSYDPDDIGHQLTAKVEWIENCHGLLHGVTRLADFVASLVPSLADVGCPGMNPTRELIRLMEEAEAEA